MKVRNTMGSPISVVSGGTSMAPSYLDIRPGEEVDISAVQNSPVIQAYIAAGVLIPVDRRPASNSRRRSSGGESGSAS